MRPIYEAGDPKAFMTEAVVALSMTTVVAFGGSILAPDDPDPRFLARVAAALDGLARTERLFVVVGGGAAARQAIRVARQDGVAEDRLDRIGIQATRLNAQSLLAFLDAAGVPCPDDVPQSCDEAANVETRVVVMGGTTPGHSTDYVGAELAKRVGAARLVVATNVPAVFTADPRHDASARPLAKCGYGELAMIVGPAEWKEAGQAGVVDPMAVALLAESAIQTCVVDGTDLDNLVAAASGKPFQGTVVEGP